MKKTASKGDKKKKKEVQEEIAKLEAELDQKQEAELKDLKNSAENTETLKEVFMTLLVFHLHFIKFFCSLLH